MVCLNMNMENCKKSIIRILNIVTFLLVLYYIVLKNIIGFEFALLNKIEQDVYFMAGLTLVSILWWISQMTFYFYNVLKRQKIARRNIIGSVIVYSVLMIWFLLFGKKK